MAHPWAHRLILLVLREWFGVQIGYKGAPVLPARETKRWNHAVSSRRFRPVLGVMSWDMGDSSVSGLR